MMVDFETFWITEEDHLVPTSQGGLSEVENIVTACAVCNRLKGRYAPPLEYTAANREAYIDEIRKYIMAQRAKHMRDFAGWAHPESGKTVQAPSG